MAITVVQAAMEGNQATGSWSATFGAGVTAGNTIILGAATFSASNVTISSASPTFNGSPVTGAAKLAEVQSAFTGSQTAYVAIWLLPAVTGGAAGIGLAVTNGTQNAQAGLMGWEVAGLTAPAADQSSTSSGAGTGATSGTTGATVQAAELVVGVLFGIDGLTGTPATPAGYTSQNVTSGPGGTASCGGYQIQASAGNTYAYANANANGGTWAGAVVTIGSASSGAPAGLASSSAAAAASAGAISLKMTIRGT